MSKCIDYYCVFFFGVLDNKRLLFLRFDFFFHENTVTLLKTYFFNLSPPPSRPCTTKIAFRFIGKISASMRWSKKTDGFDLALPPENYYWITVNCYFYLQKIRARGFPYCRFWVFKYRHDDVCFSPLTCHTVSAVKIIAKMA